MKPIVPFVQPSFAGATVTKGLHGNRLVTLLNVLINARDAMPDGGRVRVSTLLVAGGDGAANDAGTGQVAVRLADEGDGMTPEVARRATEPFFTTREPGTGPGLVLVLVLAMVHGFVPQSHGRHEIKNTPGNGTTVRMVFPVDAAGDARGDDAGAARRTGPGTVRRRQSGRPGIYRCDNAGAE